MKNSKWLVLAIIAAVSCKPDTKENPKTFYTVSDGVFIGNEGPFSSGNATVDFYNSESKTIQTGIYVGSNGVPSGSILNSMAERDGRIYLVMNNSQIVQVVNKADFKQVGTISGLQSPRHILPVSATKAYITDWVSNTVLAVDLASMAIKKTIVVGNGPERMLLSGNKLYVVNSGGFGIDSTVSVINVLTDAIDTTLVVGHNPNSLQLDSSGDLWVLCGGINDWNDPNNNTAGKMVKIKTSDNSLVMSSISFSSTMTHPANLTFLNGNFYFLGDGYDASIMMWNSSQSTLPTSAFISGKFYKMEVNHQKNEIYASDALDYNSAGKIFRYNTSGTLIHEFTAGIIPGSFLFN